MVYELNDYCLFERCYQVSWSFDDKFEQRRVDISAKKISHHPTTYLTSQSGIYFRQTKATRLEGSGSNNLSIFDLDPSNWKPLLTYPFHSIVTWSHFESSLGKQSLHNDPGSDMFDRHPAFTGFTCAPVWVTNTTAPAKSSRFFINLSVSPTVLVANLDWYTRAHVLLQPW